MNVSEVVVGDDDPVSFEREAHNVSVVIALDEFATDATGRRETDNS